MYRQGLGNCKGPSPVEPEMKKKGDDDDEREGEEVGLGVRAVRMWYKLSSYLFGCAFKGSTGQAK